MDLKQLTALVTVSDVGSATKAAALLHLVQPAVTRQIRTLEDEVGVLLFERTRQGMVCTPAGEVLVDSARRALRDLERARAEIRPDPRGVSGLVTIGLLESTVDIMTMRLLDAVAAHFPGIGLRVMTAYSGHLQQWLDAGDIDLSMLYNLTSTPSLFVTPLLRERLWAVAPHDESLSPDEPVTWNRLLEQPLVLPTPGHGLRSLVDEAIIATGITVRPRLETNSMQVQLLAVKEGRGWTVLPASAVPRIVTLGELSAAPLCDPEITRSVVLGLPRSGRVAAPVEAVARETLRVVRDLVTSGEWASARLTLPTR